MTAARSRRVPRSAILLCVSIAVCAGAGGWLRDSEIAGRWAFLALLPLLVAIRNFAPHGAAACGALWGLAHLIGTLTATSGQHLSAVTSSALVAIPMLYAWLGAWSVRRAGFHPLVLAVGWMLVEYLASFSGRGGGLLLSAMPVAGTFSDWISHYLGYVLLSFLWALINSLVVSAAVIVVRALTCAERTHLGDHAITLVARTIVNGYKQWFNDASKARAPPFRTTFHGINTPFG